MDSLTLMSFQTCTIIGPQKKEFLNLEQLRWNGDTKTHFLF